MESFNIIYIVLLSFLSVIWLFILLVFWKRYSAMRKEKSSLNLIVLSFAAFGLAIFIDSFFSSLYQMARAGFLPQFVIEFFHQTSLMLLPKIALALAAVLVLYLLWRRSLQEMNFQEENLQKIEKLNKHLEEEKKELSKSTSKLKKAKNELQAYVDELEKFNKVAVKRELKMIELKKKIKELERQLKKKS